jgi:hypothetical protein
MSSNAIKARPHGASPVRRPGVDCQQAVVLGAYLTAAGEERLLLGRGDLDGIDRLYDLPAETESGGHRYFVDSGFDSDVELAAVCRLYLEDARRTGDSPMSRSAIDRIIGAALERPREAIS